MQESHRSMVQCNDDCDCHRVVTLGFGIVTFLDRDKTFGTILRSMALRQSIETYSRVSHNVVKQFYSARFNHRNLRFERLYGKVV